MPLNLYKAFGIMLGVQAVKELTPPPHTQCHWSLFWGTSVQTGVCEMSLQGEMSGVHSVVSERSLMLTELVQG